MRAIGLDIGTTTISALVVNGDTGEVYHSITRENNSFICSNNGWEKIQNIHVIMKNVKSIIDEITQINMPIDCIGLTGQMHGILYVDKEGDAVSPLYTWQDGRGNLLYKDNLSYAEYLSKETGFDLASGYGAVTHFYNKVNHIIPKEAESFCSIQDYIGMKLSKSSKPLTHSSDAASFGVFNIKESKFENQDSYFPEVTKELRLLPKNQAKIPVAIAIGDNQASFLGSVKNNEECLLVNIGTGSQVSAYAYKYVKCNEIDVRPFINDSSLMVGSPLCGGRAYALLANFFKSIVKNCTGTESDNLYEVMGRLANESLNLENKLKISTKFSGTRKNPDLRGDINNLSTDNLTMEHFIIGVLEGMVDELYSMYEDITPNLLNKPIKLIGSGNGLRLNTALQHIISTKFNMPLSIPMCREEAAYGAALAALTAIGYFKDISEAQSKIKYI